MTDPAQHEVGPVRYGIGLVAAFVLLAAVSPAQQPIGTVTTEKWISNGSREGVSGYVMGTYVFSRRPGATPTS